MVGVFLCRNVLKFKINLLNFCKASPSPSQVVYSIKIVQVEKGREEKSSKNFIIPAADGLVQQDRSVSWGRKQSWKEMEFQPCQC